MICKVWLLYAKMNILGYKSCCRSLMVASRWVPNGRITRLKFNYSFVKCMSNTLLCANAVLSPWDRPVSHVSVTKMCIDWEGEVVRGQSVQFIHSVLCDSLRPHESQHARPPCPSQTPRVYSNSCPSSRWCHLAISSSVIPFSSCPQSLPGSGSFPMSQLFAWGGKSIGVSASASVLPVNTHDWSPLGWQ